MTASTLDPTPEIMADITNGIADTSHAPSASSEALPKPTISSTVTVTNPITILHLPNNITVRHFRPSDAIELVRHCNNHKLAINMRDRFPHPYTLQDAESWVNQNLSTTNDWEPSSTSPSSTSDNDFPPTGPRVPPTYIVAQNDLPIGSVGLIFHSDVGQRKAEIGYWLGEQYWGQGLMTGVLRAFVDWTWRTFPQLIRLEGVVFAWNKGSCRVLEKCGFEFEARRRCAAWKEGRVVDLLEFGLVREGWEGRSCEMVPLI